MCRNQKMDGQLNQRTDGRIDKAIPVSHTIKGGNAQKLFDQSPGKCWDSEVGPTYNRVWVFL